MPKLLAMLAVVAGVVYLIVLMVQRRSGGGSGGLRRRPPAVPPRAPDDDPGFLRQLDDQLWRERQARDRGPVTDPDSTGPPDVSPDDAHDATHDEDRQTPP